MSDRGDGLGEIEPWMVQDALGSYAEAVAEGKRRKAAGKPIEWFEPREDDESARPIPKPIYAITLWQPWASLIAIGVKPYETRSWRPPKWLIGKRIAIHAAARPIRSSDIEDIDFCLAITAHCGPGWRKGLPFGAVICTAILAHCAPTENVPEDLFGNYAPGRWAWKLDDISPVDPPVLTKGAQGFWRWRRE
jgi:hypothetical protein